MKKRISYSVLALVVAFSIFIVGARIGYQRAPKPQELPFDVKLMQVPIGEGICDNWKPGDEMLRGRIQDPKAINYDAPRDTGTGRWLITWVTCVYADQKSI